MGNRTWLIACVVMAAGAFSLGRWVLPASKGEATDAGGSMGTIRASGKSEGLGPGTLRGAEPAPIPPEETGRRMKTALDAGNEVGRMAAVLEMLMGMSPENWEAVYDAFIAQTIDEGRMHNPEFILFMKRAGAVAGKSVIDRFWKTGEVQHARWALQGWAAEDPEAAIAWIENEATDKQVEIIWGSMVRGVAQSDPERAIGMLETLPAADRARYLGDTVELAIQSSGIDAAAKLFEDSLERFRESGDTAENAYIAEFFGEINTHRLHQASIAEMARNDSGKMNDYHDWMLQFDGESFITPAVLFEAATTFEGPEKALEWVVDFGETSKHPGMKTMVKVGVGQWNDADPGGLDTWIDNNEGHPYHDAISAGRESARSTGVKKIIEFFKE